MNSFKFLSSRSLFLMIMFLFSCGQNYTPKPHAYYRIDFPEREYRQYDDKDCPFTFEYPVYGTITPDPRRVPEPCCFDVNFSGYRGTIHFTYKAIDNDFDRFIEENWKMLFSGIAQRADAINERILENHEMNVFGTLYDIGGNAASPVVFYLTDSVKNFLRGSLYFSVKSNVDSLAPVVTFFREDVIHLMETVRWKTKNNN